MSRKLLLVAFVSAGSLVLACGSDNKTGNNNQMEEGGSGGTASGGAGGSGRGGSGGTSAGGSGGSSTMGGSGGSSSMGGSGGGSSMGGSGGAGGAGGSSSGDAGRPDAGVSGDMRAAGDGGGTTMSFFVTSTGSGMMGGNLGGLTGADAKCKMLATAVGLGDKDWKAFLSTTAGNGMPAVSARDRIGTGPWFNQKGQMIAMNVNGLLQGIAANLVLDEKGATVPQMHHDILTGSTATGMPQMNRTCENWTSASGMAEAQVGHSDGQADRRWSAHASRCSQQGLLDTNGNGRIYCFATN